jgi:hypothetical protein
MQFLFSYVFNLIVSSVLDPESRYSVHFDKYTYHRNKLLDVIGRIVDTRESRTKAMEELAFYSANKGNLIRGAMARIGAWKYSPGKCMTVLKKL